MSQGKITEKQKEILEFIKETILSKGWRMCSIWFLRPPAARYQPAAPTAAAAATPNSVFFFICLRSFLDGQLHEQADQQLLAVRRNVLTSWTFRQNRLCPLQLP